MEASYPTWRDVDAPQALIKYIKALRQNNLIGFLVNDRVFRIENKVCYSYRCADCGTTKIINRQFEEYSQCEKCFSYFVRGIPFWKEGRYNSQTKINLDTNRIVEQMHENYQDYFGEWHEKILRVFWDDKFTAQFLSGDEVKDDYPGNAIAKAAILCPFLWDMKFNWRDKIHNDFGNDLHLTHLIMQWRDQ